MRYSDEHKQKTRERIVRAAARRFRTKGSEATVGELMRDARLTHGGFYRHFESKEDLFAEAFEQSLKELEVCLTKAIEQAARGGELKALIDAYLDVDQLNEAAGGGPVATLVVSEIARRPRGARRPFLRVLRAHIGRMEPYIPAENAQRRHAKAISLFTGMAGTLTLARAFMKEQDRRDILDGAKKFYLAAAQR